MGLKLQAGQNQEISNLFSESLVAKRVVDFLNDNIPSIPSILFSQGALNKLSFKDDNYVHEIYESIEKLKSLIDKFNEFSERKIRPTTINEDRMLRLGYYHLYGAAMVSLKLFEDGKAYLGGFELSTKIPPYLAEAYKVKNLESYIRNNDLIRTLQKIGFLNESMESLIEFKER